MRTSALFAAVAAVTAASARAAEVGVPNGTTDLSAVGAGAGDDLTFTNITYLPSSFNVGSAVLSVGTLNDLDAQAQILTISNTSTGLGLQLNGDGGGNTVAGGNGGATGDLLYVAPGGTLNTGSALNVSVGVSGNLDVAGTSTVGGPFVAASGLTFTKTGVGTLTFSTNNLATSSATFTVAAGTLSNNATSALGAGAITLGAASGSASATLLDNGNSYSLTNAITVVAGSTGVLRLTGGAAGQQPTFSGLVTVNNGATATLGSGGTSTNGLRFRQATAGGITGGGSVTIDAGAGTVIYYDNSATEYNYSGGTTIASGTLQASQNVGSGTVNLGTATGTANAALLTNYGIPTPITVVAGDTGLLRLGSSSTSSRSFGGAITLANNVTLGSGNATTGLLTFSGPIGGTGNVTIDAGAAATPGFVALGATNTFAGSVLVNTGELRTTNASALTAANPVGVSTGADFNVSTGVTVAGLNDGSAYANGTGTGTVTNTTTASKTLTLGGSGAYSFTGSVTNGSSATLAITTAATFTGVQTFNASNTYGGPTTIGGGTLATNNLANGALPSGIGMSSNASSSLVIGAAGTFLYTGSSTSTDRAFTTGAGTATINVSSPSTNLTFTNSLTNAFSVAGPGTVTLGGTTDNSYLGATVNQGTLVLAKASTNSVHAIGNGGLTVNTGGTAQLGGSGGDQIYYQCNVTLNGGTFDMNGLSEGFNSLNGSTGTVTNSNPSTPSTLAPGGNNGSSTFGGTIQGNIALSQSNNVTLTLSGQNTYAGGTMITKGMVLANNQTSSLGSGTTVVSGSTSVLGGSGNTGGPVVVGASGTITAGSGATTSDSINILDTGPQSWNSSGGYLAKVSGNGSNAGTAADLLVMSGLSVNASSGSPFAVTALALGSGVQLQSGAQILIAQDSNTSSPSGTNPFATALNSLTLVLSPNSTVTPANGDTLQLLAASDNTGDYDLFLADVMTATPEPTSLLLAGVAAAPLVLGMRRRRAAAPGVARV